MKTNIALMLLAALAALSTTSCGNPEQKIRLKVTDEAGTPIKDAKCVASWWKDVSVRDTTNSDGIVEFTGRTGLTETYVKAEVPGYYISENYKFLMGFDPKKTGNRWEPWPVELTFVMKKIVRPHPMYFWTNEGGQYSSVFFPENDFSKKRGYDLLLRDWVAPHGKGKVADFIISGRHKTPGDTAFSPEGVIEIGFSNPSDGIIEYKNAGAGGSILQGPHESPESGYLPRMEFATWLESADKAALELGKWSSPLYVFRIRTVTDSDGRVVSARYGKIPVGIRAGLYYKRPGFHMTYYLNGTDNDRGLEWDMKNNLFKDLQGKCALMGGNKP